MNKFVYFLIIASLFFGSGHSISQTSGVPEVLVTAAYQTHSDGSIFYTYTVKNNSKHAIASFSVGQDAKQDESELNASPVGWNFDSGLPGSSFTTYQSWIAHVVTTEESDFHKIEWRSIDGDNPIKSGEIALGFGVLVTQNDEAYLNGHWTVIFEDSTTLTGNIKQ